MELFAFVNICGIKGYLITRIIHMDVKYVQSFMVNNISPYIENAAFNISLKFIHSHVVEFNLCTKLLIYDISYTFLFLAQAEIVVGIIQMFRSYFKGEEFTIIINKILNKKMKLMGVVNVVSESLRLFLVK